MTFVTFDEFVAAAETYAKNVESALQLPKALATDVVAMLNAEMTVLTAIAVQVATMAIERNLSNDLTIDNINRGLRYVRVLQALGVDVQNKRESDIKRNDIAEALAELSLAENKVYRLISKE